MSSNWRDLTLLKNEFVFRGVSHDYSQVSSIMFYQEAVTYNYMGLVATSTKHNINLFIYLENEKEPFRIQGSCMSSILIRGRVGKHIEPIKELYGHFAGRTFEIRLKKYLGQISKNAEFVYDKKKFNVSGQVMDGTNTVNITKARALRKPYSLELYTAPPTSLVEKVKQRILPADTTVNTYYDQDVFYALLMKLYNIRWK
jgi:hypothetical protein